MKNATGFIRHHSFNLQADGVLVFPSGALISMLASQMALSFLPPNAAARIRTHVRRVVPAQDLCKEVLPTDLMYSLFIHK